MRLNDIGTPRVLGLVLLVLVVPVSGETKDSNAHYSSSTGSKAPEDLPFGRLFTTPEQREMLDQTRRNSGSIRPQLTVVDESLTGEGTSTSSAPQPIKLMGVLLRADGQNRVWVSGGSDTRENTVNNRAIMGTITQSANVKVPLRGLNNAAILKPGQVWNATKGRVEEAYQIPVPKPVVVEPVAKPVVERSPVAATGSSAQTSSNSSSEGQSSAQSSAK
jgi:hypothetical protein